MLNKSFGVIYFYFNIFSEKSKKKKQVLKLAFVVSEEFDPQRTTLRYCLYLIIFLLLYERFVGCVLYFLWLFL